MKNIYDYCQCVLTILVIVLFTSFADNTLFRDDYIVHRYNYRFSQQFAYLMLYQNG